MKSSYVKMEGLGNSFVILKGPMLFSVQDAAKLCANNKTDGLLVVTPIDKTNVRMEYWNADGSTAEMCGNGLRCVARFAVDQKFVLPGEFLVHTSAGVLKAVWNGVLADSIEVQIGLTKMADILNIEGMEFHKVSVGNPHAVTFVKNVDESKVSIIGPIIENNASFPDKTNVEFIEVTSKNSVKLRVWERGVGETKACGTGMVAATKVAVELKSLAYPVEVDVVGGKATVWVDDSGYSRMRGPANYISLL